VISACYARHPGEHIKVAGARHYKAEVRDVIDADTLLLDIDLGFEVIRRQPIRLARIGAPSRDTQQGAAGRRFVRKQLAVARTVVVNTRKYDIHRRYLNQELIDKGFAKVF
jgi:hypothetical protein